MGGRPAVPKSVQVEVFFQDRWLCHICRRPVVFAMTFKLLSEVLGLELPGVPIAIAEARPGRDADDAVNDILYSEAAAVAAAHAGACAADCAAAH